MPTEARWSSTLLVLAIALAGALAAAIENPARAGAAPTKAGRAAAERDTAPVARIGVPQSMLAVKRGEAVLVDVRPEGKRRLGHIQGDLSVPIENLPGEKATLPRDRTLIFYCSCPAEELGLEAARALIEAGDHHKELQLRGIAPASTRRRFIDPPGTTPGHQPVIRSRRPRKSPRSSSSTGQVEPIGYSSESEPRFGRGYGDIHLDPEGT
jgi:rhodanese-related sulfurtransferase